MQLHNSGATRRLVNSLSDDQRLMFLEAYSPGLYAVYQEVLIHGRITTKRIADVLEISMYSADKRVRRMRDMGLLTWHRAPPKCHRSRGGRARIWATTETAQ